MSEARTDLFPLLDDELFLEAAALDDFMSEARADDELFSFASKISFCVLLFLLGFIPNFSFFLHRLICLFLPLNAENLSRLTLQVGHTVSPEGSLALRFFSTVGL